MKINNPRLFNGQLLASYKGALELLGLNYSESESGIGYINSGLISAAYIPVSGAAGITTAVSGNYINLSLVKDTTLADSQFLVIGEDTIGLSGITDYVTGYVSDYVPEISAGNSGVLVTTGLESLAGQPVTSIRLNRDAFALVGDTPDAENADDYIKEYKFTVMGEPVGDSILIPKDQFLTSAAYIPSSESLQLMFNINHNGGDTNIVNIPVGDLVDEYSAGRGIAITNVTDGKNVISVKKSTNSESFFFVDDTGAGVNGIQAAIDATVAAASGAVMEQVVVYAAGSGIAETAVVDNTITFNIGKDTNADSKYLVIGDDTIGLSGITEYVTDYADSKVIATYTKGDELTSTSEALSVSAMVDYVSGAIAGAAIDPESFAYQAGDGLTLTDLTFNIGKDDNADSQFLVISEDTIGLSGITDYVTDYVSGYVDPKLNAIDKFVKVESTNAPSATVAAADAANDTLYYNSNGQAQVYDGDSWQNLSIEAITEITTSTATDDVVPTAKAVKSYVDSVKSHVDSVAVQFQLITLPIGNGTDATVSGRIINVYDETGDHCYPSIKWNSGTGVSTLSISAAVADYTIIYAATLSGGVAGNATV